jgi:hypothetical protein
MRGIVCCGIENKVAGKVEDEVKRERNCRKEEAVVQQRERP